MNGMPMHHGGGSVRHLAFRATVHCLTGCAIGEVLGMVMGTAMGWRNSATIAVSIVLAFVFGYALTMRPLLSSGLRLGTAMKLALAADTLSITIMEVVDNLIMLMIPGAMNAGLSNPLFWIALPLSLVLAGIAAFPVNWWLVARGKGHAVVHGRL